ncbi:MAG: YqaE/Pmp3 family membrane protein [Parafilimonas sp.]
MKRILTSTLSTLLLAALITPVFAITLMQPDKSKNAETAATKLAIGERKVTTTIDKEKMNEATAEFKNLSKHDRKERVKDAKKAWKQYKQDKRSGKDDEPSTSTVLLVILAIILPPLAVYLHEGTINNKFWIDLILTLLFFLPGIIYALIVVLSKA